MAIPDYRHLSQKPMEQTRNWQGPGQESQREREEEEEEEKEDEEEE